MILSKSVVYSQDNKVDSLSIERESMNGYYFQNDQFCDKLEAFMDVVDLVYSTVRMPLILITNIDLDCDCKSDSLSVVRVEIKDKEFLSLFLEINSNEIYLYGGKLKGRSIFLKQKSILGKIFRSDFGFMDALKLVDLDLAETRSVKYNKKMGGGGCPIIIGLPFMDLIVNKNGDIVEVKYCDYDYSKSSDAIIYNSVKEFRKLYEDAKATYNLKNESK